MLPSDDRGNYHTLLMLATNDDGEHASALLGLFGLGALALRRRRTA